MTFNPDTPETTEKDLHEIAEQAHDAFDDAMSGDPRYFAGQLSTHAYDGFFQTGTRGGIPYIPDVHGKDQKHYTIIELTLVPLDYTKQATTWTTAKFAAEFRRVIRPSIEALAESIADAKPNLTVGEFNTLREIGGLWVVGEWVPRPDNKEGEDYTTMRFTDCFATREECEAAFETLRGNSFADESTGEEQSEPSRNDGNDPARATMAAFLPQLWLQAGRDVVKMAELLRVNPMLAEHFTVDSPEVQTVMNN